MKKNICRILIISMLICVFFTNTISLATVNTGIHKKFLSTDSMVPYKGDNANKEIYDTMISKLNQIFGGENNITRITKKMVVRTHITLKRIVPDESGITFITKYIIQIGNNYTNEEGKTESALIGGGRFLTEPLTEDQLIKFGIPYEIVRDPANNDVRKLGVGEGGSWDATIIISCDETWGGWLWPNVNFYVEEVYTGNDIEKVRELTDEEKEVIEFKYDEDSNWGIADTVEDIKSILDWAKDPVGCIKYILAGIVRGLGDICQILANSAVMSVDNKDLIVHWATFTVEELSEGGEYNSIADKYTKVSGYSSEQSSTGKDIPVQDLTKEEYPECFNRDTRIPVTAVDFYTLSANKIGFTDANFLDPNHDEGDTLWFTLRNFIASIIYALMYIVAACLLLRLIWHGIKIVRGSFGSPMDRKKHMEGLQRFAISVVMLIRSCSNEWNMYLCK